MKTLLALIAICVAFVSEAQSQTQAGRMLKRTNPNELAFLVVVDSECGTTQAAAEEVVTGVLTRSRIKAVPLLLAPDDFGLQVKIDCLPTKTAFTVVVDFVDKPAGELVRIGLDSYGAFGTFSGDQSYLLNGVKVSVESAVTDYLKANFDL